MPCWTATLAAESYPGSSRGGAVESLQGGIDPSENRERFEEAHDLIIKCWTEPGPFRFEGKHYQYRVVNPWVLPMQEPRPDIWFPGTGSPESVVWAASHGHPYMNLGALLEITQWLKDIYIETALEAGYKPGPEHFGYLLKVFCADTDEKAIEMGRRFLWTENHRQRGPREHVDPPGYQSRGALKVKAHASYGGRFVGQKLNYDQLRGLNNIIVGSPDTVVSKLTEVISAPQSRLPAHIRKRGRHAP